MRLPALHWQILFGMALGAAVGLTLNASSGVRESVLTEGLPQELSEARIFDSTDLVRVELTRRTADGSPGQRETLIVDGSRKTPDSLAALRDLEKASPTAYKLFQREGRSTARRVGDVGQAVGGLFLRLLKMVSIPLIVVSLSAGVMSLGGDRLGRMFSVTLLYYLSTSLLAIVTGLTMVNLVRPGLRGGDEAAVAAPAPSDAGKSLSGVLFEQLETIIPENPAAALAESSFLSVISFTLAFSIFANLVGGKPLATLRDFAGAALEVMMAMTMAIIRLAPLGVLFLMLSVTATQGPAVFASLFYYMLAVLLALLVHAVIVLPLILKFVARRNPWEFAQAMSPALLTAFSSASSNGTLPLTIACAEQKAGVSNRVASFVLPLGATVNMDGTALYEAVAVLFIAQLHHGANLELSQQIIVAVTALLASVGAAGIPHAGLVMMVIILQAVNLPTEMQGIILAVDRVLDMCRTTVNVWSDSCGCAVVAQLQGEPRGAPSDPPPGQKPRDQ